MDKTKTAHDPHAGSIDEASPLIFFKTCLNEVDPVQHFQAQLSALGTAALRLVELFKSCGFNELIILI